MRPHVKHACDQIIKMGGLQVHNPIFKFNNSIEPVTELRKTIACIPKIELEAEKWKRCAGKEGGSCAQPLCPSEHSFISASCIHQPTSSLSPVLMYFSQGFTKQACWLEYQPLWLISQFPSFSSEVLDWQLLKTVNSKGMLVIFWTPTTSWDSLELPLLTHLMTSNGRKPQEF